MKIEKDLGIRNLIVMGDSELVVNHVKNKYQVTKCKLKAYLQGVSKLIKFFSSFNIMLIHRDRNHRENSLVVSASFFNQNNISMANPFKVGMIYRPTVPENEGF